VSNVRDNAAKAGNGEAEQQLALESILGELKKLVKPAVVGVLSPF
jgi:hypothetical protein